MTFIDPCRELLIGISAVIQSEPSLSCGKNSVPKKVPEITTTTNKTIEAVNDFTLCLKLHLKPFSTIRSQNSTNGLCFSRTFLFSSKCDKTGTKVKVKSNAPIKAKPSVKARGENIFPSTFWKENIGSKAVMIINFEKKIDLPISVPVFFIKLPLANLLNFSIPTSLALRSRTTNSPSTITTAPSMIIPKSTAPRLNKLALIPINFRHKKAKSNDSGITIETVKVVRQSAMNKNTMQVTRIIPSSKLCITVSVVKFIKLSRS